MNKNIENPQLESIPDVDSPNSIIDPAVVNTDKWRYVSLGLLLIVLVGGAYIITQKQSAKMNYPAPTSSMIISPQTSLTTPTPLYQDINPVISPEWEYKSLSRCDVSIPIPPKKEPYYYPVKQDRQWGDDHLYGSGVYWMFPGGGTVPPVMLMKLPPYRDNTDGYNEKDGAQGNYKSELAMLGSENRGGSGFVDAAFAVNCMVNSENMSYRQLTAALLQGIDTYNKNAKEDPLGVYGPDKYTVKNVREVNKWGKQVLLIDMDMYYKNSGGEPYTTSETYTVFTTPKFIYEITKVNMAEDSFLKKTTNMMYDNLKFL